jgi:hypothetical protein
MNGKMLGWRRVLLGLLAVAICSAACTVAATSPSASVEAPAATAEARSSADIPTPDTSTYALWSPDPNATASDTPTPTDTLAPTAPPKPKATPPAAGQPWGGLVIATASNTTSSNGYPLLTWKGQTYGMALASQGDRTSLARQAGDGSWVIVSADIPAVPSAFMAGNDSVLVVMQGQGANWACKTGADGDEECSADPQKIWTSPDGMTWTSAGTLPGSADTYIMFLVDGPAGFIAGANRVINGRWSPVIWISPDGISWRQIPQPASFKDAIVDSITAVHGGYVATGGRNRVQGPASVGAIGGSVAAWWSTDGVVWSNATIEVPKGGAQVLGPIYETGEALLATGFLKTEFCDCAADVSAAWTSTDHGRTWHYHATDTLDWEGRDAFVPEIPVSRWGMLATDGHRFVSFSAPPDVGQLSGAWESFDGVKWHKLTVNGLGYLNSFPRRSSDLQIDDSGVVISWNYDGTSYVVRGWATP